MMSKHYASAKWEGNLKKGKGQYKLETSGHVGHYNFSARFEDSKEKSSPEELIGAALASCFSMALSNDLDQAGHTPESVETRAEVTLEKTDAGFSVTTILLKTKARVEGIEKAKFDEIAAGSKKNCPVSRALKAVDIKLEAELIA